MVLRGRSGLIGLVRVVDLGEEAVACAECCDDAERAVDDSWCVCCCPSRVVEAVLVVDVAALDVAEASFVAVDGVVRVAPVLGRASDLACVWHRSVSGGSGGPVFPTLYHGGGEP